MENKVIECSYNLELQTWNFMQIRHDKKIPNAYFVHIKAFNQRSLHSLQWANLTSTRLAQTEANTQGECLLNITV